MSKHTPGPWRASIIPDESVTKIAIFAGSEWIATAWGGTKAVKTNARLIAAAPDLLAACQLALDSVDDWHNGGFKLEAQAAIAKAQGE